MPLCEICKCEIPAERLSALPDTTRCVVCVKAAGDPRVKGRMVFEHKTAPVINVMPISQFEETQKQARRGSYGTGEMGATTDWRPGQKRDTRDEGRVPNDKECRSILDELAGEPTLDEFEVSFIASNRDAEHFSSKQKIICRRMAGKYDLRAWQP